MEKRQTFIRATNYKFWKAIIAQYLKGHIEGQEEGEKKRTIIGWTIRYTLIPEGVI